MNVMGLTTGIHSEEEHWEIWKSTVDSVGLKACEGVRDVSSLAAQAIAMNP